MTFDQIYKVIKRGDLRRLRNELERGLNPNLCNQYSWTLLMVAAMKGNTSIGTLLIEKGADLDIRNNFRNTALSLAAQSGHPSFVKLLLKHGASLECYPFGQSIDDWLSWIGEYTSSQKQASRIRSLFESEGRIRALADGPQQ